MIPEFVAWPKIARLSREIVVTEKLDGTNANIFITEDGQIQAGSRTRWITPQDDNFGFAKWVEANTEDLLKLGPGHHFGEWWGKGIQRGYGLSEKRFSLFNVAKWQDPDSRPKCCGVVPVLYRGDFDTSAITYTLTVLADDGSMAAPGFMKPEGIIIFHTAANRMFKKTLEGDQHKEQKH